MVEFAVGVGLIGKEYGAAGGGVSAGEGGGVEVVCYEAAVFGDGEAEGRLLVSEGVGVGVGGGDNSVCVFCGEAGVVFVGSLNGAGGVAGFVVKNVVEGGVDEGGGDGCSAVSAFFRVEKEFVVFVLVEEAKGEFVYVDFSVVEGFEFSAGGGEFYFYFGFVGCGNFERAGGMEAASGEQEVAAVSFVAYADVWMVEGAAE